jgi:hypothetical protein
MPTGARLRKVRALRVTRVQLNITTKTPAQVQRFSLFQPPRLMAEGVNVDPLGSCAIGANELPVTFLGLFAMRPVPPPNELT